MVTQTILDVFAIGVVLFLMSWVGGHRRRKGLPLPPGPTGLPFIGSILSMPTANEWVVFRNWSLRYSSDILHIGIFGTHTIIVNSAQAAKELFNNRSALYSDRPAFTALQDYLGFNYLLVFTPYGPKFRALRKGVQEHFHQEVARTYQPLELYSTHAMLRAMVESPKDFREHIRHMTGRIILRIAYGIDVTPEGDPFVLMAEDGLEAISVGSQFGGMLFDIIPILQKLPTWFPGVGVKRFLQKRSEISSNMLSKAWSEAVEAVENGTAQPSVTSFLMTNRRTEKLDQAIPANLYVAGADTTVSSIQSFFLAMILHPDAQSKAQDELDRVLGGSRLPTFEDEPSLPYVQALVCEVLRWHPVTPLGVVHRVISDDVYEGLFIPEGSTVIGNVWAILHDSEAFPDPDAFRPEHFLPYEIGGTLPPGASPFPDFAFGFGRRVCPGRHMARASVWIACASILAAFNISPALDDHGKPIPVREEYTSGIVAYPAPFECTIKPRSKKTLQMIMETSEDVLE